VAGFTRGSFVPLVAARAGPRPLLPAGGKCHWDVTLGWFAGGKVILWRKSTPKSLNSAAALLSPRKSPSSGCSPPPKKKKSKNLYFELGGDFPTLLRVGNKNPPQNNPKGLISALPVLPPPLSRSLRPAAARSAHLSYTHPV